MRYLAPAWFERIAAHEGGFGRTIHRAHGIRHQADRGRPYQALVDQPDLARRALQRAWHEPVLVQPAAWAMPAGAFSDGAGPT